MTIRKAVIPVAGLGTRHFPASHAPRNGLDGDTESVSF